MMMYFTASNVGVPIPSRYEPSDLPGQWRAVG